MVLHFLCLYEDFKQLKAIGTTDKTPLNFQLNAPPDGLGCYKLNVSRVKLDMM